MYSNKKKIVDTKMFRLYSFVFILCSFKVKTLVLKVVSSVDV